MKLIITSVSIFLIVSYPNIFAQNIADGLSEKLEGRKEISGNIEQSISELEEEISKINVKRDHIQEELNKLRDRLEHIRENLELIDFDIKEKEKNISLLVSQIKEEKSNILKRSDIVREYLVRLHQIKMKGENYGININLFNRQSALKVELAKIVSKKILFQIEEKKLLLAKFQRDIEKLDRQKELLAEKESEFYNLSIEYQFQQIQFSEYLSRMETEISSIDTSRNELSKLKEQNDGIIGNIKKIMSGNKLGVSSGINGLSPLANLKVRGRQIKNLDTNYSVNSLTQPKGITIESPDINDLRTLDSGIITYAGVVKGFGNVVILSHGNSDYSVYGFLDEIFVDVGQKIEAGTFFSTPLVNPLNKDFFMWYFEVRRNGKPVDPNSYITFLNNSQ